ncbi:ComF family protein [Actinosynnema sp. CA-299493]
MACVDDEGGGGHPGLLPGLTPSLRSSTPADAGAFPQLIFTRSRMPRTSAEGPGSSVVAGIVVTMLIDLLFPPRCPGCGTGGVRLCARCPAVFGMPKRVPGVGPPVFALAAYGGAARELVLAFKERGRRELAVVFGALVAAAVPRLPGVRSGAGPEPWLVPAPSRASAARARGGSHVLRMARASGFSTAPALAFTSGVRDSVRLDAASRQANLAGRVRLVPDRLPPPGTPLVLLDDVVTTGSTARACVSVLKAAGFGVPAVLALTTARRTHPHG